MTEPIDGFFGPHAFLSNFHPSEIILDGISYPTVEHAYQAMKTLAWATRSKVSKQKSPGGAKKMGQRLNLRPDWEEVKLGCMYELVRLKFEDPELRMKLMETEGRELIEKNTWRDTFWGVFGGKGENHLGKILMMVRDESGTLE